MKRGKPYTMAACKTCQNARCKKNYEDNKPSYHARSNQWAKANPERMAEIKSKSSGAYYWKVSHPLVNRAVALFERMNDRRRERFAQAILNTETPAWVKAKRSIALDEWLGAYSGI